jgi:hypothetical protein
MEKTKAAAILLMFVLVLPVSSIALFVQGQSQLTLEQNMVRFAEQAENQIQNLVNYVNSNETAIQKIENASLLDDWQNNVTLYETDGLAKLATAQEALKNSDYNLAADSALEALVVFKEVYSSLNKILEAADLQQKNGLIEVQALLDVIDRELQRIVVLREILPANSSQETWNTLDSAQDSLNTAKELLLEGKISEAKNLVLEVKQKISQIYDYLKMVAEDSNTWRINQYCERLEQRIQERFRYGHEQNINFTATLQAHGYQNANQFMQALKNSIQNVQTQGNPQNAVQQCELLGQMVQEMEQALNQEINKHQGNAGSGGGNGAGEPGGNGTGNEDAGPSATSTPGAGGSTTGGNANNNNPTPSPSSGYGGNGGSNPNPTGNGGKK